MPKIKKNETKSEYMGRCIPYVMGEAGTKSRAHAIAKCNGMWEQARPTMHLSPGGNQIVGPDGGYLI
jgi:hypothetical protein